MTTLTVKTTRRHAPMQSPPTDILHNLPEQPARARDVLFEYVAGLDAPTAIAIIVSDASEARAGGATVKVVADRLARLLGVRKVDAARLMGVSESTVSRRTKPSADVLDRALAVSGVLANVTAALGPDGARQWLRSPNPALAGRAPLDLLHTRAGERQVENVVEALLNGAYL